ncbi:MAG TPA: septal ring lytic transglycosylase RlpA family protein [Spirochaetota bacterium]|nr:septal ring lytic transglycosylase RlpA family protein [Spirochaetota bacterium]
MKKLFFVSFLLSSFFLLYSFEQSGVASWYGPNFHGKLTANGEIFNTYDYTAAHKTLPFGSIVKVISLENNSEAIVRINDRGPFKKDRIIDLSQAAADKLGVLKHGTMNVRLVLLETGNNKYHRYHTDKYEIRVASFSNYDNAVALASKLKDKKITVRLKETNLDKTYYRLLIDDLNYSELQLYRVKLHDAGVDGYKVIKKL